MPTTPASVRSLIRRTPTIARISNRAVISVSGSQASEFLNGLLTTSVTNPPHGPFYSAFLQAQVRSSSKLHGIVVSYHS